VRFIVREGTLEENHPCMIERNSETVEFSPKAYSERMREWLMVKSLTENVDLTDVL